LVDLIERITDWDVFKPARYAFKAIGPSAVPALVDLIERSEDWLVLMFACDSLGEIGEPAALPALRSLTGWFSGMPEGVKKAAREAIWEIEKRRRGK
jgi:hypothetical protein